MMQRDEATQAQVNAARPASSTWLSANAGSGKTRVLTDRVARLLLTNVPPERILCLTYTKAAASEMQNRLFKRLGEWAMLPADELRSELAKLGTEGPLQDCDLRRARTLFAAAIEAPGGLKIQTIHSFCSSVLRRFPLEAGVTPQFTEMEDRAAALLREEIIEDMAQGKDAHLLIALNRLATVHDLTKLTGEIVSLRDKVNGEIAPQDVRLLFGLPSDASQASIINALFDPATKAMLNRVIELLGTQSSTYQKQAATLSSADLDAPNMETLAILGSVLFYSGSNKPKIGKYPQTNHSKARDALAAELPALDDFMERMNTVTLDLLALAQIDSIVALNQFAAAFLTTYDTRKRQLGWLDFDDLILKTRDLLTDPKVAAWVLYRLDGGIDHILVDEAQDTSPEQWAVIERLSEDFLSGEGARSDVPRTIFVVGDKKQSIYSFQGADPREFDRMQEQFADRLRATNTPLVPAELQFSFRSSPSILRLVDETFQDEHNAGFGTGSAHRAFNADMPGRVDIWPHIPAPARKSGKDDPDDMTETIDQVADDHHHVVLAKQIASELRRMIDARTPLPDDKGFRPLQPGDVLILVQRRGLLFEEIIRACKQEALPIAGADRLKVGAELAVRDIRALLAFLATPEDDYSLAVALKSPLFGWSEKQLYTAARARGKGYLWEYLRGLTETYPDEISLLKDMLAKADFLRPYDLIERLLTRHACRKRLIGRLGKEAEDGIDALLSQALAFERTQTPSLTGFLTWMETDDLEIKRQMSQGRNEIRVMTVHGSKGLEAPVVIMPDTEKRGGSGNRSELLDLGDFAGWNTNNELAPQEVLDRKAALAERADEERMRLLYVAMTRAEKWLIVAAAGDLGKSAEESWYGRIKQAADRLEVQTLALEFGEGQRIEPVAWGSVDHDYAEDHDKIAVELPDFLLRDVAERPPNTGPLSPSDLGGAKALPSEAGLDEEAAMERGTWVHLLLEHFAVAPPEDWRDLAGSLLPPDAPMQELLDEASAVINAPHLSFIFTEPGLSEVAISAPMDTLGGRHINGVIDRLVTSDDLWIIDFKTNAGVPENPEACPEGVLRQMGAYRAALCQVYPNHSIRSAIVWTANASLMELPETLTSAALHRAGAEQAIDDHRPHP